MNTCIIIYNVLGKKIKQNNNDGVDNNNNDNNDGDDDDKEKNGTNTLIKNITTAFTINSKETK